MIEQAGHVIHTSKYTFLVVYFYDIKQIKLNIFFKLTDEKLCLYQTKLCERKEQQYRKQMCKYRYLNFHLTMPTITLQIKEQKAMGMNKEENLSDNMMSYFFAHQKSYGVKYYENKHKGVQLNAVFDPHHKHVLIQVLSTAEKKVKTAQTTVTLRLLKGKSSPLKQKHTKDEMLFAFFQAMQYTALEVFWEHRILKTNPKILNPINLKRALIITNLHQQQGCEKLQIFKHIFLTELIAHMITSEFGRKKCRLHKYRDGNLTREYEDEELEELRSCGYRYSEFRDHPFKPKKPKKKKKKNVDTQKEDQESEDNYEDDDQDDQEDDTFSIPDLDSSEQEILEKNEILKNRKVEQKKTKLQKIKINMKKAEKICNFTFISGKDKSKINTIRCCLNQMTRETDKTQALIDFVCLAFKVYPREELISNGKIRNEKGKMRFFLKKFRVKLEIKQCLKQYTRESFFHRILNTGLRTLKQPYELAYLRLPFSHIFWSIKRLYHHQKKVAFADYQKNSKKNMIMLYRGFQITEKEIKRIKKNINGYIEIEGFLSTTLSENISDAFIVNAKMIIEVPIENMGGIHDNGYANISCFSEHESEKEVLVNALNVFKILSLHLTVEDEMIVHTLRLEYGSIKPLLKKLQKSQQLLDAEYFYFENCKELKKAKIALEINKNQMSTEMYEKLKALLPKAEKQLQRRRQYLKKWAKIDYQSARKKLSEWEKELSSVVNQEKHRQQIENYGDLLLELGEYRRASVYSSKRVKQVQLDRAVEGYRWRNCQFLIHKEHKNRKVLYLSLLFINRLEDSFLHAQKLLDMYISTKMKQSSRQYLQILYFLSVISGLINKLKESKKYWNQFVNILEKYKLYHTYEYKKMQERQKMTQFLKRRKEKIQKQNQHQKVQSPKKKCIQCKETIFEVNTSSNEGEQENDEQKEIQKKRKVKLEEKKKQIKEQLQKNRLYGSGKYSAYNLQIQSKLIGFLYIQGEWKQVIEEGMKYMNIRRQISYAQKRLDSRNIFKLMLESCVKEGNRQQFYSTCSQLASFIPSTIYHQSELSIVHTCLKWCLKRKWFRACRSVLIKFTKCKVKPQLSQSQVNSLVKYTYVLLLLSMTEQTVIDTFIRWTRTLYQQQSYTSTKVYKNLVVQMIECNDEHSHSVFASRNKDEYDDKFTQWVQQTVEKGGTQWHEFKWDERTAQLIPFQHPVHPYGKNTQYIAFGTQQYLIQRQQLSMLLHFYRQMRNIQYNLLEPTTFIPVYLRMLRTFSQLHLNDYHLNCIPSLFHFYPLKSQELFLVLADEMGIDFQTIILHTQHLRNDYKSEYLLYCKGRKESLRWRKKEMTKIDRCEEVRRARRVYARFKHYQLFTSHRRHRTHKYNKGL